MRQRFSYLSLLLFSVTLTSISSKIYVNAIDCDHFTDIYGGIITYNPLDNGISLPDGTTATLTCSDGGFETTATCSAGTWNPPSLGSCGQTAVSITYTPPVSTYAPPVKRVDENGAGGSYGVAAEPSTSTANCAPLTAPANSFIGYNYFGLPPYPRGTMATLNCHLGYAPVGMTAAECEGGSWSKLGTCQSASVQRCPPLLPIMNGIINYIPGGNGAYDYGSVAELSCGFGYSVSGNPQVTCESSGWTPSPGLGQCQETTAVSTLPTSSTLVRYKRQSLGLGTTTSGIGCSALSVFNGQVNYMQSNAAIPYSSGTMAILVCSTGNTVSGSTTAYCSNGVWSPTLGTCNANGLNNGITSPFGITTPTFGSTSTVGSCPAMFALIMNGQITYSTAASMLGTYNAGTVASLNCYSGSTVSGTQSATCNNGAWSPTSLGSCVTSNGLGTGTTGLYGSNTASCLALGGVLNGQVTYSLASSGLGQYPSGTTATMSCTSGLPTGSTTSTCQSGVWTPTLGTCSTTGGFGTGLGTTGSASCYIGVMSMSGGTVSYSNGLTLGPWTSGTTATLTCPGTTPIGQSTASCQNGVWSPSSFQGCSSTGTTGLGPTLIGGGTGTSQCYIGVMSLSGGTVSYSTGLTTGPWASGTTATLTCPSGSPLGISTASCQNGVWTPSSFQGCSSTGLGTTNGFGTGTVTGTPCYIAVMSLNGGTVSYSTGNTLGPWNSGTTASLTCPSGLPTGQSTATCQNGQWNPTSFQGCSTTSGTPGIGFGTTVSSCYLPMAGVIGGTVSYSTGSTTAPWPAGSTASLTCTNGQAAQGQTTATCQNGMWSPTTFTGCGTSGLGSNNWGLGTGTSTSTAQCYATLIAPLNGQIQYSTGSTFGPFPSGSTAYLTCNSGYSVSGTSTATCYGGQFSPTTLGTCVYGLSTGTTSNNGLGGTGSCYALPQPLNGIITYSALPINSAYSVGSMATLTCNLGYTPLGTSSATCQSTGWSSLTLGTCMQSSLSG
uniref:Sushi domain-containing protein n=1 Tax=Panagrellus redivivus TaxID=6233 RepID=A0A7E4ZZY1_PANRE